MQTITGELPKLAALPEEGPSVGRAVVARALQVALSAGSARCPPMMAKQEALLIAPTLLEASANLLLLVDG